MAEGIFTPRVDPPDVEMHWCEHGFDRDVSGGRMRRGYTKWREGTGKKVFMMMEKMRVFVDIIHEWRAWAF